MSSSSEPLVLGQITSDTILQPAFGPLLEKVVDVYRVHHRDLRGVYVLGSVSLGEALPGQSDLDVIGISEELVDPTEDERRRQELIQVGSNEDLITYVDNVIISMPEVIAPMRTAVLNGHLCKLAISGRAIWGKEDDFSRYLPSRRDLAFDRTARVSALMQKYRDRNLIEPFRRDPRLLARSCAKAAIRVISDITILRGAKFYASSMRTAEQVEAYAPEGFAITAAAIDIIQNPTDDVAGAMRLADQAVALFYNLFPDREVDSKR